MPRLTTIEGIGERIETKLKQAGVRNTDTLLAKGATRSGRQAISASTAIREQLILKFVNQADLMRIRGVGSEYAELLEAAGVDSVPELKHRNPANLYRAMTETNELQDLVRLLPPRSRVADWIDQAGRLPRVVTH